MQSVAYSSHLSLTQFETVLDIKQYFRFPSLIKIILYILKMILVIEGGIFCGLSIKIYNNQ